MTVTLALWIVTWTAIVLLYLALAAAVREVRLLRGTVLRAAAGEPDLRLGPAVGSGLVIAADSGCALCLAVIERLNARHVPATVLTHEPAQAWAERAGSLRVVSDREAWRAVSHLSPPVLMLLDEGGAARKVLLPVRVEEVDAVLAGWERR
jgi:hypothetical protein